MSKSKLYVRSCWDIYGFDWIIIGDTYYFYKSMFIVYSFIDYTWVLGISFMLISRPWSLAVGFGDSESMIFRLILGDSIVMIFLGGPLSLRLLDIL